MDSIFDQLAKIFWEWSEMMFLTVDLMFGSDIWIDDNSRKGDLSDKTSLKKLLKEKHDNVGDEEKKSFTTLALGLRPSKHSRSRPEESGEIQVMILTKCLKDTLAFQHFALWHSA